MTPNRKIPTSQDKEPENYWNSGRNGNMEEYRQYLVIKSKLEGKSATRALRATDGGRVTLGSHYPGIKRLLYLILFVHLTHIASAYALWGPSLDFALKCGYWLLSWWGMLWYFTLRRCESGTLYLIDHYLADLPVPRSLCFYLFLWGWLFSVLNFHEMTLWLSWAELLFLLLQFPVDVGALSTIKLPRTPSFLKTVGELSFAASGTLLLMDACAERILSRE